MAGKKENRWNMVEDKWVPPSAIYTASEVMTLLKISKEAFYALTRRDDDPLPLRRFEYKQRYSVVLHDELMEWVKRNLPLVADLRRRSR